MNRRPRMRVLAVLLCCGLEGPSWAPLSVAQEFVASPAARGEAPVPAVPAVVGGFGGSAISISASGASAMALGGALSARSAAAAPQPARPAGPTHGVPAGGLLPGVGASGLSPAVSAAGFSPVFTYAVAPAPAASAPREGSHFFPEARPGRSGRGQGVLPLPRSLAHDSAGGSALDRAPAFGPSSIAGSPVSTLLPRIDFSSYSPESLNRRSAAAVHEAGRDLMDRVLGAQSIRGREEAAGVAPGPSAVGATRVEPGTRPEESGFAAAAPARRSRLRPSAKSPAAPAAVESADSDSEDEAAAPKPNSAYAQEKDVYSAHRLSVFEWDPEEYILNYLLGVEDPAPKGYELLVGLAAHKAKEALFSWIKAGRPAKEIVPGQVIAEYDKAWKAGLEERSWKAKEGWRASDYYNRGRRFIERRFLHMHPFDRLGQVVLTEEEMRWTIADPASGKTYKFKGRPDLVTVKGDTLIIWDWKTYFNPPTLPQLLRDDYQLAMYVMALRQNQPDLLKGRKVQLRWGYKEFDQTIDVDDAYLARVQERVLSLIHGIETLTERFELERPEWEKRLQPQKYLKGLKETKADVDALGELQAREAEKRSELKGLKRKASELEEGLGRFAAAKGLSEISGKTARAAIETKATTGLPTKTDWPEENEALAKLLKESGAWGRYSRPHPASLRAMAEVGGGADHKLFERVKGFLRSEHLSSLEVEPNEEAAAPLRRGGGIAAYKIAKADTSDDDAEPGVYSPHRLLVYAKDPKAYALKYMFRVKSAEPRHMDLLVGVAVHETLEEVFTLMKGGRPVRDLRLAQVLELYRKKWAQLLSEGDWVPEKGLKAQDHRHRGELYLQDIWKNMYPFTNQGQIIYLERRMFYSLTDPETRRTYKFQGIPDRVMLEGETVVIRDWKTHWHPLTKAEVRDYSMQLGIYVRALQQLYPGLMAGRKVRLDLDTMHGVVRIDADEAFLKKVDAEVFDILRGIEGLKVEVERDRAKWESMASSVGTPRSEAQAAGWVDQLAGLKERIAALEQEIKASAPRQEELEAKVIVFARQTGRARIVGRDYTAVLRKKGSVTVPTKTLEVSTDSGKMRRVDNEEYRRLEDALRASGVWERYSELDYAALKKAMADPKHPDREVFRRIEPLMRTERSVKVKVEPR